MPGLNNREQFQPDVGFFGSPNRGPDAPQIGEQLPLRPQPDRLVSPLAANIPTRTGAGPSTPQAPTPFCPTCGQRNQPSPLAGLVPNINTAGRQAPLAQPVSQNTGGRGTPGKSFGGSLGRF